MFANLTQIIFLDVKRGRGWITSSICSFFPPGSLGTSENNMLWMSRCFSPSTPEGLTKPADFFTIIQRRRMKQHSTASFCPVQKDGKSLSSAIDGQLLIQTAAVTVTHNAICIIICWNQYGLAARGCLKLHLELWQAGSVICNQQLVTTQAARPIV